MGMIFLLIPIGIALAPFVIALEALGVTFSPFAQVIELWVNYFSL